VLWEDQIIYIWHSVPGSQTTQALAGYRMLPAWQSVIGMALLAEESDEQLKLRFTDEQWRNLAPHVEQQRKTGRVIWHHDDGEVSMAIPVGASCCAGICRDVGCRNDVVEARLQALQELNAKLLEMPDFTGNSEEAQ
jgi:DNA-binding IclR family transcriptional regulator